MNVKQSFVILHNSYTNHIHKIIISEHVYTNTHLQSILHAQTHEC